MKHLKIMALFLLLTAVPLWANASQLIADTTGINNVWLNTDVRDAQRKLRTRLTFYRSKLNDAVNASVKIDFQAGSKTGNPKQQVFCYYPLDTTSNNPSFLFITKNFRIDGIVIKSSSIPTKAGIKIGNTLEDLKKAYGRFLRKQNPFEYRYQDAMNDSRLVFSFLDPSGKQTEFIQSIYIGFDNYAGECE